MVFRRSQFDSSRVAERLRTESRRQVQSETNHVHLVLYVGEPSTQRSWGARLCRRWEERLKTTFPDLNAHVVLEELDGDVVVTVFATEGG